MGVGRVQGTGGRGGNSLLPPPRLNPGTQMPPQRGASQAAAHIPVAVPSPQPQMMPLALIRAPWKSWETLAVSLSNVPPEANTFVLWQAFKNEGHIFSIDLFEDARGRREHRGKIRFKFVFTSFHLHYQGKLTWNRPPPHSDFWRKGTYTITLSGGRLATIYVHLDTERKNSENPSPVRPDVSYPAEINLPIHTMDIGVLWDNDKMLPMRTVGAGSQEHASLIVDVRRRAITVSFQLPIFNARQKDLSNGRLHDYRLKIPFSQLTRISQIQDSPSDPISHAFTLDTPPVYHRKIRNIGSSFVDADNSWRDADTWYRQTDIVRTPEELAPLPVCLRKAKPLIDIGKWTTFRITYPRDVDDKGQFTMLCDMLRDFNVIIESDSNFSLQRPETAAIVRIWKWIDPPDNRQSKQSSSLEYLVEDDYVPLPFSVRYQLEVCLSHGYISEFRAKKEFIDKLAAMDEAKARRLLEHVSTEKIVYHDPMEIFNIKFVKGVTKTRLPSYCCYMRSAKVTPSTVYYNTPSVDITNRVIRHYIEHADRFLRVRFTDEKLQGRINSTENNTMDEVFTRIKRTMANGITIGDRHYEFLAFGNSQFREHGAYFFAPLPNLTASNIRAWMGSFGNIRNIAKHAARLGQCFSTTRAVTGCSVQVCEIEDIVRNGYTFSDGVGRISKFLAEMAKTELKIKTPSGDPPSVFQFRLGGCKGILTVSPEAQRQEIHIRKSQYKFAAIHNGLEIIRWSQFCMATLNRQLIIVLSTLGIQDQVFLEKMRAMLGSLDEAMTSESHAIRLLQKYVDPNQMSLVVGKMVEDGFQQAKEPFVMSLLELWRAWQIKYLKEKAKIAIDKGACLFGCMDDLGILKGHFEKDMPDKDASYEEKLAALPEIFVQVSRPDQGGSYQVIEGPCILARNPSLHPGDIRVVKAVNVPQLREHRDVIVMPQTGDRDISSMCSGGDLDGDDYLVIWDPDLLPEDWFRAPMDYTATKADDLDRDVTVNDITSFFVTYMKNDHLPRIAQAHLAFADRLEGGVNEEKCIRLAQLHSDAVDYNKTGAPARMTRNLTPKMWPHFMEKKHQPKEKIYTSRKILGQLYDNVDRVNFVPHLEMSFDQRILDCDIEPSDDLKQFAKDLKDEYDASMRRIMAQHEIKTEFEVWSTFVLSHANMSKDYKFHEELGALSSSLRERFRNACYEKVGGRTFELLSPLAVAMYKVTHDDMVTALNKYREKDVHDGLQFHREVPELNKLPFISFPWVLSTILGKIAMGDYEQTINREHDIHGKGPVSQKYRGRATGILIDDSIRTDVETVQGIQPSGQLLELFQHDPFSNNITHDVHSARQDMTENSSSIDSLDDLLDFGLSESSHARFISSASTAPVCLEADFDLLDLDDKPEKKSLDESHPAYHDVNENSIGQLSVHESANSTMEEDNVEEVFDIVEQDGDVKPSPLDILNQLLNGSVDN
ncbi:hypothetical protein DTO280E4_3687 [Paecilomyces variotii]|nr:hypothetical protein DTO280E4_3687 [Paecilomyces variotii]